MSLRSRVSWNSVVSLFSLVGTRIVKFAGSIVFVNIAGSSAVGIYFVFLSVYRILNRGTTLGLGTSVVKRVSERKRSATSEITDTVATAFVLRAVPLLVISIGLLAFHGFVDDYIGIDFSWLFIIASLWLTALYSTLRSMLLGQRHVDAASGFDLLRDLGTAIVQVGLVLLGYAQWGLIAGFVIGMSLAGVSLLVFVRIPVHTATFEMERARSLVSFAKFSYLDNLVGGEHRWLDVIILGFFVSASSIGIYGVVYSLALFGMVFSAALSRNVLPEISHLSSKERSIAREKLVYRSLSYSTLLSFPILAGSLVIADRLLLDIYSVTQGGTSLVILTAGILVYSAYQQLHQLIYALDMPGYAFALSALSTVFNALVALLLVPFLGILGTAISTSISMAVAFVAGCYLVINRSEVTLRLPIRPWTLQAACAGVMAIVVFAIWLRFDLETRLYSALLILIGASLYFILIFSIDSFLRMQIRQLASRVAP